LFLLFFEPRVGWETIRVKVAQITVNASTEFSCPIPAFIELPSRIHWSLGPNDCVSGSPTGFPSDAGAEPEKEAEEEKHKQSSAYHTR
jgi:hypothetical protein